MGKQAQAFEFTWRRWRGPGRVGARNAESFPAIVAQRVSRFPPICSPTLAPFCGSNQVVQVKAPQDVLRPRFLIPFTITPDACRQKTAVWLQDSWMVPRELNRLARKAAYTPIYIPLLDL
ncbi:MAG: hypothetical protein M5U34_42805 [Chloroflexi bacterium]|nr:hypothetical protein [Chloroflexota bacterium]